MDSSNGFIWLGFCRTQQIDVIPVANEHIDCLAQDCSNSSALAMELLQSCAKPSTGQ